MAQADFRVFEKKILRGLIADDKLEELQNQLQEITAADDHKDLATKVILNAGRLSDLRRLETTGTASGEEIRLTRNQIRNAFFNIIEDLPDEISVKQDPSVKLPQLMTEQRFKSILLGIVVIGKLFLIGSAFVFDAFRTEVLLSIVFLQLTTLMVYLSITATDISRRRSDKFPTGNDRKTVSSFMQRTTFGLLFLYFAAFFLFLYLSAKGNLADNNMTGEPDFKSLIMYLGMVECGFGILIGWIVSGLFREK
jgi:Effector-associated domain 11